jgi:serine/threonine protein phosphatase PrpC
MQNRQLSDIEYNQLLTEGVQQANQAMHDQNQREHGDMGTTMTTALIIGSSAYVANVGDSRTYIYREDQGLSKITHDHSLAVRLLDAGMIEPEDIYTHPQRNLIYRSLGEKANVEVDPFQVALQPGDKLLLCSNGLWHMARDPMIEKVMHNPIDPSQIVNDLIQLALDGGGEDNISVIVVQAMEPSKHAGKTGMQILAKPDTLVMPNMP